MKKILIISLALAWCIACAACAHPAADPTQAAAEPTMRATPKPAPKPTPSPTPKPKPAPEPGADTERAFEVLGDSNRTPVQAAQCYFVLLSDTIGTLTGDTKLAESILQENFPAAPNMVEGHERLYHFAFEGSDFFFITDESGIVQATSVSLRPSDYYAHFAPALLRLHELMLPEEALSEVSGLVDENQVAENGSASKAFEHTLAITNVTPSGLINFSFLREDAIENGNEIAPAYRKTYFDMITM